jgi:hypothetical protein
VWVQKVQLYVWSAMGVRTRATGGVFSRTAWTDPHEVVLRICAAVGASVAITWAIYSLASYRTGRAEHSGLLWSRGLVLGYAIVIIALWCVPLLARAIGWRNARRPRDIWLRSLVLAFVPVLLIGPPPHLRTMRLTQLSIVAMTTLLVSAFALERRVGKLRKASAESPRDDGPSRTGSVAPE